VTLTIAEVDGLRAQLLARLRSPEAMVFPDRALVLRLVESAWTVVTHRFYVTSYEAAATDGALQLTAFEDRGEHLSGFAAVFVRGPDGWELRKLEPYMEALNHPITSLRDDDRRRSHRRDPGGPS